MTRRRQRGQALVEFAIIIPIILVMVFGLLDVGRAVFTSNTIAQAARQAGRTAMVDQDVSRVQSTAFQSAPTLGLGASNVSVCFKKNPTSQTDCSSATADACPVATRVIGCLAIVEIQTTYEPMTPIIGSIIGSVPLTSVSVGPIEYVCPYGAVTTCF